ncbi:WRKY transcription factor 71-like [Arachis stenosperma]|uniref:WRKY transcription factor 71-like n=1 Tax=Arachis stenosperma TaxID=217475 RepID=UPI0025AC82B6|nr:WRKY transcription factor 71-like [Arachis stenosperma]
MVISNNNITNNRAGGPKRSVESIVGGNGNLRGNEPDDEEDNIITRLKLRSSTMASVADTMRMNNKRNKNNFSKITYLIESESENLEDGYKWRKSYYYCTAIGFNAKKRVERTCESDGFVYDSESDSWKSQRDGKHVKHELDLALLYDSCLFMD